MLLQFLRKQIFEATKPNENSCGFHKKINKVPKPSKTARVIDKIVKIKYLQKSSNVRSQFLFMYT